MDRLIIVIIVIAIGLFLATYFLSRFFRNKRIIKYIPALACLIIAVINMILIKTAPGEGFEDLAKVVMAMLLFAGFLSGMLSALYFDYVSPKFKRRK